MSAIGNKKNRNPVSTFGRSPSMLLMWTAVLLAHLPLCIIYCSWLWSFDHYRFFPFVFVGVGWLVWSRVDFAKTPGRLATTFSWLLLATAIVVLAVGTFALSPWIGWLAIVIACGAFLVQLVDSETNGSLLYLWIPIWLTLRLPLGRDLNAIHAMQSFTSKVASRLLDSLGCIHLMSGNVLELPERRLMVEEACSGVQSLFTMLFLAAIYCAIERRSLSRTLGLLASAIFWTLFLNVIRVVTIAIALSWFGIDLTSGWIHEVLGFAILAIAFLMLLSSDRFLFFLLQPIPDAARDYQIINPLVSMTNWFVQVGTNGKPPALAEAVDLKQRKPAPRTPRRVVIAIPLVMCLLIGGFQTVMVLGSQSDSDVSKATAIVRLEQTSLTDEANRWTASNFQTQTRGSGATWGPYSDIWTVRQDGCSYYVDFSYPFAGWHDLTVCYQGAGWQITDRNVHLANGWPYVVANMKKPTGESGCVVFSAFRHTGESVDPGTKISGGFKDRARKAMYNWKRLLQPTWNSTYQAQVHFNSDATITDADVKKSVDLHLLTRESIRQQFLNRNRSSEAKPLIERDDSTGATP